MLTRFFDRKGIASAAAVLVIICGLLGRPSTAAAQTQTAVEYYYSAWNFYFITAFPDEVAALDGGAFGGVWKRTGQTFQVWSQPTGGALPTCRFFSATFAPKSSHFYTPYADECAARKADGVWQYEAIAFYLQVPDRVTGNCPAGTTILYRLYNDGMGGAPNHRFTISAMTFNRLQAMGWVFEGDGRTGAFACVPAVLFQDTFSVTGIHLDFGRWTTEIGPSSFLGRTQLADWVTAGGVGKFVVDATGAQLSLSTFNPTGFSLYGTHGKTLASFQPAANTTLSYTARLRLTSLQPGLVYGLYLYGCQNGPCATHHDEIDMELVTNLLQPGASPLKVQVNTYANEPLGAGNGALINLPAGFDPLAAHDWTIRWSLNKIDYLVDGTLLTSTNAHVPQGLMQANVVAWAPAADWNAAYSPSLQPVASAAQNQTFSALLSSVVVTSSSSAALDNGQSDRDLTCTNGTLIADGTNAGFGSFARYQSDWHPQTAADAASWRTYGGHVGGFGYFSTLEYLGCANNQSSVWLQFGYDALLQVAVRDGWLGSTDRGLRIGDPLSRVQTLYPEAVRQPTRFSMQPNYDVWVVEPVHPRPDQPYAAFRIALKDGRVAMLHVTWENPTNTFAAPLTVQNIIGPYDRINVSGPISSQYGWDWTVQPIVAVQAQPAELSIAVGQDATLWMYFFGDVNCCSGQWTSSAPSIVRIDSVAGQYGHVHAVAPGDAMITVRQSPTSPHTGHVRVFVTP